MKPVFLAAILAPALAAAQAGAQDEEFFPTDPAFVTVPLLEVEVTIHGQEVVGYLGLGASLVAESKPVPIEAQTQAMSTQDAVTSRCEPARLVVVTLESVSLNVAYFEIQVRDDSGPEPCKSSGAYGPVWETVQHESGLGVTTPVVFTSAQATTPPDLQIEATFVTRVIISAAP